MNSSAPARHNWQTADFNFSCGLFSISGTRHEMNSTQTYRAAMNCISYRQKRHHVAASCRPLRPLQYRWCVVSLNRESPVGGIGDLYYESFSHAFGVCKTLTWRKFESTSRDRDARLSICCIGDLPCKPVSCCTILSQTNVMSYWLNLHLFSWTI